MSMSEPIGMLGAVDLLFTIARKHGFDDYDSVLNKIIGKDYMTISLGQWGDRARKAGYLMDDDVSLIDSIDLLFAQERIVGDRIQTTQNQIMIDRCQRLLSKIASEMDLAETDFEQLFGNDYNNLRYSEILSRCDQDKYPASEDILMGIKEQEQDKLCYQCIPCDIASLSQLNLVFGDYLRKIFFDYCND